MRIQKRRSRRTATEDEGQAGGCSALEVKMRKCFQKEDSQPRSVIDPWNWQCGVNGDCRNGSFIEMEQMLIKDRGRQNGRRGNGEESECAQCLWGTLLQQEAGNGQYLERAVTKKGFDFSKMGELTTLLCAENKDAVDGKLVMQEGKGAFFRQEVMRFNVCLDHSPSNKRVNFQPKT